MCHTNPHHHYNHNCNHHHNCQVDVIVEGAENNDWEDIASDTVVRKTSALHHRRRRHQHHHWRYPDIRLPYHQAGQSFLYIADTGSNKRKRRNLHIYKFPGEIISIWLNILIWFSVCLMMIHRHMHTSTTSPVERKFPGQIISKKMIIRLVKMMMLMMMLMMMAIII